MRAARRGDREAFGALYLRFARVAHGVLVARLPAQEADDLVHDVFVDAWIRLAELRDPAAFGAWIATMARRRAADWHRRRRRTEPLAEHAAPDRPDITAEASAVLAMIRELPAAYRETLVLRLVEGLSGPEIAAVTGLTPASVRVNLHRGFRQLRDRLGITT